MSEKPPPYNPMVGSPPPVGPPPPYQPMPPSSPYQPMPPSSPYQPMPPSSPYQPMPPSSPYQPMPPSSPYQPMPSSTPIGFVTTAPGSSSTTFVSQQTSYGSIPVVVQPVRATDVIIVGGCPACRVGVLNEDFTLAGLCCAFWFFPIGILCCLAMRERCCSNCGAVFT